MSSIDDISKEMSELLGVEVVHAPFRRHGLTRPLVARHEAAHAIVAMSIGQRPVYLSIKCKLSEVVGGGVSLYDPKTINETYAPVIAVAGMVGARHDWLGFSDALLFFLYGNISTKEDCRNKFRNAIIEAKSILVSHRKAHDTLSRVLLVSGEITTIGIEKCAGRDLRKRVNTPGLAPPVVDHEKMILDVAASSGTIIKLLSGSMRGTP